MGGKAHAQRRAAEVTQQAADARKQLAVDHHIQRQGAQGAAHTPDVSHQPQARTVIQRVQMLRLGQPQEAGYFLVFLELQDVHGGTRIALAQRGKHRAGQHHTSHF